MKWQRRGGRGGQEREGENRRGRGGREFVLCHRKKIKVGAYEKCGLKCTKTTTLKEKVILTHIRE